MVHIRRVSAVLALLLLPLGAASEIQISQDGTRVAIVRERPAKGDPKHSSMPVHVLTIAATDGTSANHLSLPAFAEYVQCQWVGDRLLVVFDTPSADALEAREKLSQAVAEEKKTGSAQDSAILDLFRRSQERNWQLYEVPSDASELRKCNLGASAAELQAGIPRRMAAIGEPVNLAVTTWGDKPSTAIYDAKTLRKISKLEFAALPAGHGWSFHAEAQVQEDPLIKGEHAAWIQDALPENARATTRSVLQAILLLRNATTRIIPREEIEKACYREARHPARAAVDGQGKTCALLFSTDTIFRQYKTEYTFGLFDLSKGRLLFRGDSNNLEGQPLVREGCVYILEAKDRHRQTVEFTSYPTGQATPEVVLARHDKDGRKVVAEIPLGKGEVALQYAPAPAGDFFMLQVSSVESGDGKLLMIPARDPIKLEDIQTISIKEKGSEQE